MTDDTDELRGLIDCGSEIAGAVDGTAISMIASPPGALLGAAAGPIIGNALQKTCVEISNAYWVTESVQEQVRSPPMHLLPFGNA